MTTEPIRPVPIDGAKNGGASPENKALADVIGPASVSGGIVSSVTTDAAPVEVGYLGEKRYIRLTLKPTGLTNGGPIAALVIKGHPRHAPQ